MIKPPAYAFLYASKIRTKYVYSEDIYRERFTVLFSPELQRILHVSKIQLESQNSKKKHT